jgi:uncharacterized low-complexity protein
MRITRTRSAVAGALLLALAACSDREAEVETANTEVEVSTSAPDNAITNEQLNDAAVNAALAADPTGAPFIEEGAGGTTALPPVNTTAPAR